MPYLEIRNITRKYKDFTLSASFGVEEGGNQRFSPSSQALKILIAGLSFSMVRI